MDSFREESREEREASERRLETLVINKINEVQIRYQIQKRPKVSDFLTLINGEMFETINVH